MSIRSLPPPLPQEILARRDQLPRKPKTVTLTGQFVRLEPLVLARDAQPLFAVSNGDPITIGDRTIEAYDADALVWRYMSGGPFDSLSHFTDSLQRQVEAPNGLCLCVFDVTSGQQIGVTNFMNNVPADLKIDVFRSSGPGGQSCSAVAQIPRLPTSCSSMPLASAIAAWNGSATITTSAPERAHYAWGLPSKAFRRVTSL